MPFFNHRNPHAHGRRLGAGHLDKRRVSVARPAGRRVERRLHELDAEDKEHDGHIRRLNPRRLHT